MIKDKKTLQLYLDADKFALEINRKFPNPFLDSIWIFERTLRFYEYHKNVGNKVRRLIYGWLLNTRAKRLGFSISGNCFGLGLRINHYGLLIINSRAKIGKWCDIHQGVNVGENGFINEIGERVNEVPEIGDFCFIGPGVKMFGNCRVGSNTRIGANTVINKDIPDNHTAYGNPIQIHHNKRNIITIAKPSIEEEFLKKYPQYRKLINNL